MSLLDLFFDRKGLAEATAKRKARFAEIDTEYADKHAAIQTAKETNRKRFKDELAMNNVIRNAHLHTISK